MSGPSGVDSESAYRSAVKRWHERDLDAAVRLLQEARADSPGPVVDTWWFAIERALAQIALELDDLDDAERYLRRLPGHFIGQSQTLALRGRRQLLLGEPEAAAAEVASAVGRLEEDPSEDSGSLMNGALALSWCGDVLAEAGFGQAAGLIARRAHARVERAGIVDGVIEAALALIEASAARLTGNRASALALLAAVDTSASPDFAILAIRERARLKLDQGDHEAARILYREAVDACEGTRYVSLGRRIVEERVTGAPEARPDDAPIETWAARRRAEILAAHRPYAVVVHWVVDPGSDRHLGLEARVAEVLAASPGLGTVDGTGGDGETWDLFLDGEDPGALWAAVRPVVEAARPTAGSTVSLRKDGDTEELGLE